MEANKILNADILDIIFEGKNKAYGAYELRKTYNSRMYKAMLAMVVLLLVMGISLLLANSKKENIALYTTAETQIGEVKKDEILPTPKTIKHPPPLEVKQVEFTPPIIKNDDEVKNDEIINDIDDDAAISTQTVNTDNTNQKIEVAPEETKGSEVIAIASKPTEDDDPFTKVEQEAEFPGGAGAWGNYLRKNLNGNVPNDNNAPAGSYTVIVRFIVDKDGSISDVTPETSHGYGMEKEAVKIIQRGPSWTPALQNGNIVKAYRRQPVTFQVVEE